MRVRELYKFIKQACSRETSYFPKQWSASNPCYGQCCMIALAVNEFCGAKIYRTIVTLRGKPVYHYFNRNIRGRTNDLSVTQFKLTERFDNASNNVYHSSKVKERDSTDLLRQPAISAKYTTFKNRLMQLIAEKNYQNMEDHKKPIVIRRGHVVLESTPTANCAGFYRSYTEQYKKPKPTRRRYRDGC